MELLLILFSNYIQYHLSAKQKYNSGVMIRFMKNKIFMKFQQFCPHNYICKNYSEHQTTSFQGYFSDNSTNNYIPSIAQNKYIIPNNYFSERIIQIICFQFVTFLFSIS